MSAGPIVKDGMRLVRRDNSPVFPNDTVTDFRGDTAEIIGGRPPHRPGTSGYVWVITPDDELTMREFYPTVFDLRWEAV